MQFLSIKILILYLKIYLLSLIIDLLLNNNYLDIYFKHVVII